MPPHIVRYPPIQCNTRERCDQLQIPAAPPAWRVPEGPDNLAAAPMGGGRAWPGFEGKLHHTQRHKRRRCGGRRRVRRARAGFEIDHSEPQARVWRSRGQPDPKAPGTLAVPQATKQQGQGVGGPGCGARGRWRGLAGLRDDAPSEARSADGSRAGRRPRAHQAARPSKAHHAGGRTRRRPEHQRRHKQREPDTRKPRPADAGRGQPTQSGGKA